MAKRKTAKNSKLSKAHAKEISAKMRQHLEDKIGVLTDDLIIEFGGGPKSILDLKANRVGTDWPDSFDRNTWYKTWAKSGGDYRPPETVAQRAAAQAAIAATAKVKK